MYCHVLPCIAVYSHVLPCIATDRHILPCIITMFSHVRQYLLCIAMYSHVLPCITCIDIIPANSHALGVTLTPAG